MEEHRRKSCVVFTLFLFRRSTGFFLGQRNQERKISPRQYNSGTVKVSTREESPVSVYSLGYEELK